MLIPGAAAPNHLPAVAGQGGLDGRNRITEWTHRGTHRHPSGQAAFLGHPRKGLGQAFARFARFDGALEMLARPSQSIGQGRFQIGDAARGHAESRNPLDVEHAQGHGGT